MSDTARTMPFDRPEPLRPPPAYAELRAHEPVTRVRTSSGRAAWLVTSYDEVVTVLEDPRFGVVAPGTGPTGGATLLQDGAEHQRLRRLVGKAFTPRRVEALRPRVRQLADERIGALTAAGAPADLVTGFAAPLSISVIAELLGVRIEERDRFREFADTASKTDFLDDAGAEEAEQAWMAFAGYVGELISAKRARLGDDLLSALIEVRDTDAGGLTDDELTMLVLTILASGYLTATNAISVGTTLLAIEGRLAALGGYGSGDLEAAVEEVVRLQIGLIGEVFPRWAHADLSLAGVPIQVGDLVLARLGAANRDPAHFDDPDTFDPSRFTAARGHHVAFGRSPHHCLGAALARLQIGVALSTLALRLPGLKPYGSVHDIEWIRGHADAGPIAVHVTW